MNELREPRANAEGLLADLTGQLLNRIQNEKHLNRKLDLGAPLSKDCSAAALEQQELPALYGLFRAIIKQLPKAMVIFCIIDGISAYENSDRRADTFTLMGKLARLARNSKQVALRCLATHPGVNTQGDRWCKNLRREAVTLHVPEIL